MDSKTRHSILQSNSKKSKTTRIQFKACFLILAINSIQNKWISLFGISISIQIGS
jgi:hypothetical protein